MQKEKKRKKSRRNEIKKKFKRFPKLKNRQTPETKGGPTIGC